jgi:hypothetical protein
MSYSYERQYARVEKNCQNYFKVFSEARTPANLCIRWKESPISGAPDQRALALDLLVNVLLDHLLVILARARQGEPDLVSVGLADQEPDSTRGHKVGVGFGVRDLIRGLINFFPEGGVALRHLDDGGRALGVEGEVCESLGRDLILGRILGERGGEGDVVHTGVTMSPFSKSTRGK